MKFRAQNNVFQLLLSMSALVIIFAGIKAASQIIVPFLLALFLTIIVYPIVRFASRHRVPLGLTIIFIASLIIVGFLIVSIIFASSLNDFAQSLPVARLSIMARIQSLQEYAESFGIYISTDELINYFDPLLLMNFITQLLSSFSGMLTGLFLLLMTIVFMLFEVNALPYKLKEVMDDPNSGMVNIKNAIRGITGYMAIKTIISLITGIVVWAFLSWLDIGFALLWGMTAFLLNYIPNIGSIIAAILPIFQSLIFNGFYDALLVSIGFIIINIILGNIIEPRVMGKGLGLSTLVVFLSLIFWGWLLGPIGMVLSVPLTIVIKILLENSPSPAACKVAVMLGDQKKQARADQETIS